MKRLFGLAFCSILAGTLPAVAHHSLAVYDRTSVHAIVGTVKTFEWSNPHARLVVVVPTADGAKEWDFEGGSPGRLTSGGFVKGAVVPGDKITVKFNPRRDGSMGGFFTGVVTAEGKAYNVRGFGGNDDAFGRGRLPRDGVL